jgi:hypothetical protein
MKGDGGNDTAIFGKAVDFGALGTIKLRPLCNQYLERCIRNTGLPTFLRKTG